MERYLTKEEQQALLGAAKRVHDPLAQRDYHIMGFLLRTGLRVGEFCQISIADAQQALKTGALFVPREHRKGGGMDLRLPLTDEGRRHLRGLLLMTTGAEGRDPLVAGPSNQPITTRSIQLRVQHWAQAAGLPGKVSPHWLRHSRAMDIMRASTATDPRGIVQRALGHASVATTGIYTEPSKEDVAEALKEVDGQRRRPTLRQLRRQFEGGAR